MSKIQDRANDAIQFATDKIWDTTEALKGIGFNKVAALGMGVLAATGAFATSHNSPADATAPSKDKVVLSKEAKTFVVAWDSGTAGNQKTVGNGRVDLSDTGDLNNNGTKNDPADVVIKLQGAGYNNVKDNKKDIEDIEKQSPNFKKVLAKASQYDAYIATANEAKTKEEFDKAFEASVVKYMAESEADGVIWTKAEATYIMTNRVGNYFSTLDAQAKAEALIQKDISPEVEAQLNAAGLTKEDVTLVTDVNAEVAGPHERSDKSLNRGNEVTTPINGLEQSQNLLNAKGGFTESDRDVGFASLKSAGVPDEIRNALAKGEFAKYNIKASMFTINSPDADFIDMTYNDNGKLAIDQRRKVGANDAIGVVTYEINGKKGSYIGRFDCGGSYFVQVFKSVEIEKEAPVAPPATPAAPVAPPAVPVNPTPSIPTTTTTNPSTTVITTTTAPTTTSTSTSTSSTTSTTAPTTTNPSTTVITTTTAPTTTTEATVPPKATTTTTSQPADPTSTTIDTNTPTSRVPATGNARQQSQDVSVTTLLNMANTAKSKMGGAIVSNTGFSLNNQKQNSAPVKQSSSAVQLLLGAAVVALGYGALTVRSRRKLKA